MSNTPVLDRLRARAAQVTPQQPPRCKICESPTRQAFALPHTKLTGQPIPAGPDDCPYYECSVCRFLFSTLHDGIDHGTLYDDTYWKDQDPDWGGRVHQTLRLVLMANQMLHMEPWTLKVLDFGCGMGTFVQAARDALQMQVFGTDIIRPRFGLEWFLPQPQAGSFDVVVSCEVLEHLPQPFEILSRARDCLRPGGVLAFQTAEYDPQACGRDWWYLGPANGHISLYSRDAFDVLAEKLGVVEKRCWNGYPGLQAWKF